MNSNYVFYFLVKNSAICDALDDYKVRETWHNWNMFTIHEEGYIRKEHTQI